MDLSQKLQELRKRKGLTQEELARALYVSRTAVSKWESGRGYPNIDSLKAIAGFFGVTVDALLSGEELLSIAEADTRDRARQTRCLVFGLLDISSCVFFFLPFFAQRTEGTAQAMSYLELTGVAPWLKLLYGILLAALFLWGVLTLVLQTRLNFFSGRVMPIVSLAMHGGLTFSLILSLQPYGAAYLLLLLAIKVILLPRRQ